MCTYALRVKTHYSTHPRNFHRQVPLQTTLYTRKRLHTLNPDLLEYLLALILRLISSCAWVRVVFLRQPAGSSSTTFWLNFAVIRSMNSLRILSFNYDIFRITHFSFCLANKKALDPRCYTLLAFEVPPPKNPPFGIAGRQESRRK